MSNVENNNNTQLIYIYKTPSYVKKAQKTYYEKIKDTDKYKNRMKEHAKKYYYKNKNDPEFMKKKIENSRTYYNNNKEQINAKRYGKIINDE